MERLTREALRAGSDHLPRRDRRFRRIAPIICFASALAAGCDTMVQVDTGGDPIVEQLVAPAPRLPVGYYDFFGALKTPAEARQMVLDAGLDPLNPEHASRIGLVHITDALIEEGRQEFFQNFLGDPFTISNILGIGSTFGKSVTEIMADSFNPAADPEGALSFLRDLILTAILRPKVPTTNLQVLLSRDLRLGTTVIPAGSLVDTGADVALGQTLPVGFESGQISCGICHASVDTFTGQAVLGRPNTDVNIGLFIALARNSAGAFIKLNHSEFDPFAANLPLTGRRIMSSDGSLVRLPDPAAFEAKVDDFLMNVVRGDFDAGPDAVTAMTKIPDSFVFGEGGMGWDGGFQVGPFGGVSAFSNAVHSFEINLLSAAQFSRESIGVDPEVYLGLIFQNAADPGLRPPEDSKPSEWLAVNYPEAERERLVPITTYPNPSLFSLNGLVFSPKGRPFMQAVNALAAFQSSLTIPPNRSLENLMAIQDGSVTRGARVFASAGCIECHAPPFFTNGQILSSDELGTQPLRGRTRRGLRDKLVAPMLPAFDQPVPLPSEPVLLAVPPTPAAPDNLEMPGPLKTDSGGYKVTALLGIYFRAPYLHDASVAVAREALALRADGGYAILDSSLIGVTHTMKYGERPADPANSLRALIDRDLRHVVIENNAADPDLVRQGVEGIGHDFFVDPAAGFTYAEQSDLIAFLLSLDDDPGRY